MILNSAPQNEAILSNVGQVTAFTIDATAKSFQILSSSLYSNKIRAIIRELSCNAVDSHVAAGNEATPFDVHLPNSLEPWFAVRDYGVGLSHDEIVNIFSGFFKSTKTASNAFIGALGLGSKTPFSYTDNFTVTTVKDCSKRIYAAFINEVGVPSIVQMSDHDSDEPNGVEIKFSVNDRYDFNKFIEEARQVYTYFKLRPVISGGSHGFTFIDTAYADKDIIPGVHVVKRQYRNGHSMAVMGNIAYPINIPDSDKSLGDGLINMLQCELEIHFGIGELDFQPSREGLSYIPMTIAAIKRKLEAVSAALAVRLTDEANKIDNLWERAVYVVKRHGESLWMAAAAKYAKDTKCPLVDFSGNGNYRYEQLHTFRLTEADLALKYNIVIRGFHHSTSYRIARTMKPSTVHVSVGAAQVVQQQWPIGVSLANVFVFNDLKVGSLQRAKYHWKNTAGLPEASVYVIERADRKMPIKKDEFLKDLMNPPAKLSMMASTLLAPERAASLGKNVTILKLEARDISRSRWNSEKKMVWAPAGKAEDFDKKTVHYYLPVKGFQSLGLVDDVKSLHTQLKNSEVFTGTVYGVRKADIEYIKTRKNWVNLDKHVVDVLSKLGSENVMSLVKQSVDFETFFKYNITSLIDASSPVTLFVNEFKDVKAPKGGDYQRAVQFLCQAYKITTVKNEDPTALIKKWEGVVKDLYQRYPLLKHLDGYDRHSNRKQAIADYVKLVDAAKPV